MEKDLKSRREIKVGSIINTSIYILLFLVMMYMWVDGYYNRTYSLIDECNGEFTLMEMNEHDFWNMVKKIENETPEFRYRQISPLLDMNVTVNWSEVS